MLQARIRNSIRSFQKVGGGFVGLLDTYGGADAAYSVRRLSSTYTGALIEVRRTVSAVTVTADVAFDSNNQISLDSEITVTGGSSSATNLGEFVAASGYSDPDSLGSGQDAFIRTWYDQSGNANNAQQTTTTSQPQIVSSGSIILENGNPALSFDGTDDGLTLSSISYTNISTIAVAKTTSVPSSNAHAIVQQNGILLKTGQNPNHYPRFQPYDSGYKTAEYQVDSENQQLLLFGYTSSGNAYIYVNNNVGTSASISTLNSPAADFNIGLFPTVPNSSNNGPIQEVIIYSSDQSSNRTGIQTNINDFYSIY